MAAILCLVLYASYQLIAVIVTGQVTAICDGCDSESVALRDDPVRFVWSVGFYSVMAISGSVLPAKFVFSRAARQRMQKLWRDAPSG